MRARVRRSIERIARQFDQLRTACASADKRSESVSQWSVGQHVDHLIKADESIFVRFPAPDEEASRPVTAVGRIILWSGWIPRGKGKAPSATQPDQPGPEALLAGLDSVKILFEQAIDRPRTLSDPRPIAKHPYFGGLNRAQWLRFVAVHHHHHGKIIRDIVRAG